MLQTCEMVLLQSVVVTGLYKEANMDQENKNNEQEIIRTTTVSEPEVVRATTTVNEPARTSITYDEAAKTTTTVKQSVW
jgi:ribosomal protein L5